MKIFKDKELKQEITVLDFGILEAGEFKIYTFYVLNDSNAELKNLSFSVDHIELTIIESPKTLKKNQSAELKIKWTASVTLKEGLHTQLKISGTELWG